MSSTEELVAQQRVEDTALDTAVLLIRCADSAGLVAHVSGFLSRIGASIVEMSQFSSGGNASTFFQRAVVKIPGLNASVSEFRSVFQREVADPLGLTWQLQPATRRPRIAIMVSRHAHCLLDLLWQARSDGLPCDIGLVMSNHTNVANEVCQQNIPFVHIPTRVGFKSEFESLQLEYLRGNFDLIVLARYMQVLTTDFLAEVGCPVINIHHSFLPAFAGSDPYGQAKARGVKIIGATAHYATPELDDGPIIEQDTIRVSHLHTVADLRRIGSDIERTVLTRAVRWHCEYRLQRLGNATIVL